MDNSFKFLWYLYYILNISSRCDHECREHFSCIASHISTTLLTEDELNLKNDFFPVHGPMSPFSPKHLSPFSVQLSNPLSTASSKTTKPPPLGHSLRGIPHSLSQTNSVVSTKKSLFAECKTSLSYLV